MTLDGFLFNQDEFTGKSTTKKKHGFIVDPCLLCGLFKKCQNPKMVPFGDNEKRILVIGEAPGSIEDEDGIPFVGKSGKLLRDVLFDCGVNMDVDCARTNVQQCFISGKIKVFTSKGYQYISKLKKGDLILTHKGRFKKVIWIKPKSNADINDDLVFIKWGKGRAKEVVLTPEHPLYIRNNWINACDLKKGDLLTILAKKCVICGKLIEYNSEGATCSHSCTSKIGWNKERRKLASDWLKNQYKAGIRDRNDVVSKANEKTRELVREGKFHFQKGNVEFEYHCKNKTKETYEPLMRLSQKVKKKNIESGHLRKLPIMGTVALEKYRNEHGNFVPQKGKNTRIERIIKDCLIVKNIQFEQNKNIGVYHVDFFLSEYNIAIECDGDYWHNLPGAKERDKKKDIYLNNLGYLVLRFKGSEILSNAWRCIGEIENIIRNHDGEYYFMTIPIKEIRHIKASQKFPLYNIGVEEDESYVVKGIVFHNCFVDGNTFLPEKSEFCYDRLEEQIKKAKPKLIFCFGQVAAKRILENKIVPGLSKDAFGLVQGDVYVSRKYNCWISLNYHPAHILRNDELLEVFYISVEKGLNHLNKELPKLMVSSGKNTYCSTEKEAIRIFDIFSKSKLPVSIDYEANQLNPFIGNPELLMISLSIFEQEGFVVPLKPKKEKVWDALSLFLKSNAPKTAQNAKFEDMWTRVMFGHPINNLEWDTILSAHIVDERRGKKSLAYLVFAETGEVYKDMIDVEDMRNEIRTNIRGVITYSSLDARFPVLIRKSHESIIKREGLEFPMQFLMEGNRTLADMEENGVKIDLLCYEDFKKQSQGKFENAEGLLLQDTFVKEYEKKYHRRMDWNSNPELGKLFFKVMGLKPLSWTAIKKDPQVTQELYDYYKSDEKFGQFFTSFLEYKRYQKLIGTSIEAIKKYVDKDGFIHPTYNLWIPTTFRSSCKNPNLQNVPTRDEEMKEIRKVFVPRFDYLLELDFKGADICAIAMESGDRVLTKQIKEDMDMHRYWASRLYQIEEDKISKTQRFDTKGGFVFAEFYGSYYKNIAINMGLSERHVRKVENEFWDKYWEAKKWIDDEQRKYQENGYVTNALGFRRRAPLSRNQIIPSIIQGDMFLGFLLDTMIRARKMFKKYKIKSLPIMQVHDSLTLDIKEKELNDVIDIVEECALNKTWDWCKNVKLKVDWTLGANWLEMEKL